MDYRLEPLAERHRAAMVDIFSHYVANSFAAYPEQKVGYEFYDMVLGGAKAGYPALAVIAAGGWVAGFGLLKP